MARPAAIWRRLPILILALAAASTARSFGSEPFQFRGVGGNGISSEKGLLTNWTEKEGIRWKTPLPGRGLSNPVAGGGRIYVTACDGYEQKRQLVLCFDEQTGKELWTRQVWGTGSTLCHPKTNMAAPTPVTDGERVYVLFATGDVACYSKNGDLEWYRSLVGDYPTVGNNVGMASSPTLWKDVFIICMENVGESFAVGLDARTGQNRWRVDRPRGINWVSPFLFRHGDQTDVVFQGARDLSAHDPATGKVRWSLKSRGFATMASASPIDGIVYAPGEKFAAIAPVSGAAEPKIVWENNKIRPAYCSPVVSNERLFTITFGGIVTCSDAKSGKSLWTHRLEGNYSASPLVAEDRLFVLSEEGLMTIFDTKAAEPTIVAANQVKDTFMASPVASNGALLLRSDKYLYCIGKR